MKCPSCGMENSETQIYCTSCGSALYGPRSVNLTNNNQAQNNINDIRKITGIDINSLPIGDTYVSPGNKNNKPSKNHHGISISTILFVIIIFGLSTLSGYLYLENRKLNNVSLECPKVEKCVCENKIEGIFGTTSRFAFYLPSDYRYKETSTDVIINNDQVSLIIYGTSSGQIDQITAETIKNQYTEDGYANVVVNDEILSKRKIIYAAFEANEINFIDFYYQYDSEKFIYGQIASSISSYVITNDIKDILSSITIEENHNFNVPKAPVSYGKIFSLIQ